MSHAWGGAVQQPAVDSSTGPVLHVATISPRLPNTVCDRLLTATEEALTELGATRIWVDPVLQPLAVMAEFPLTAAAEGE